MTSFRPTFRGIKPTFVKTKRELRLAAKRPAKPVRPIVLRQRTHVRYKELAPPSDLAIHRRGPRRTLVGEDPFEARAVSHEAVAGTLPERMFYKTLLRRGLREGRDFVFQVSFFGGRQEIAGMVADFVFYNRALIVRVQTPWHIAHDAQMRDDDQRQILEDAGWNILDLWDSTIYNDFMLEQWVRQYIDSPFHTIGFQQAAQTSLGLGGR